jgi:hypothetical protein
MREKMPIKTIKKVEEDFTEHIVSGEVTDKEMFDCEKEFYLSGPTKLQFWDMTKSKLTKVTVDGMRQFVARTSRLGKSRAGGRTAVLVQSQIQFGLGRMAEAFGDFESLPFEFRIFREREEAIRWLHST